MARRTQPKIDKAVLEMAVVGYQHELDKLSARMAEIRTQLAQPGDHSGPKRRLSASARARIAAAQKARWAAYKKAKGEPAKARPVSAKRKLSAAGRRAIQEATRKRWAAFHKAQRAAAKA